MTSWGYLTVFIKIDIFSLVMMLNDALFGLWNEDFTLNLINFCYFTYKLVLRFFILFKFSFVLKWAFLKTLLSSLFICITFCVIALALVWQRLAWYSLCSLGWPWTHNSPPTSAAWVLESQEYATKPDSSTSFVFPHSVDLSDLLAYFVTCLPSCKLLVDKDLVLFIAFFLALSKSTQHKQCSVIWSFWSESKLVVIKWCDHFLKLIL